MGYREDLISLVNLLRLAYLKDRAVIFWTTWIGELERSTFQTKYLTQYSEKKRVFSPKTYRQPTKRTVRAPYLGWKKGVTFAVWDSQKNHIRHPLTWDGTRFLNFHARTIVNWKLDSEFTNFWPFNDDSISKAKKSWVEKNYKILLYMA